MNTPRATPILMPEQALMWRTAQGVFRSQPIISGHALES
jgi:hypothetical protein